MKAGKGKASHRGKKRARRQPVLDCVTRSLIENGVPLIQRNWIVFAYLGDKGSIDELDAEELANAPGGFEDWRRHLTLALISKLPVFQAIRTLSGHPSCVEAE
jgi:hypothetical protein